MASVEFVPSVDPHFVLCQTCWAKVVAGAAEQHAEWHERTETT